MRINMQNRVKEVLEDSIHCRDSDVYLLYEVWADELKTYNLDIKNMHLVPTLKMWANKEISRPSAIMRARRKVQEENPNTRGNLWEKRHKEQVNVQKDLGYNVNHD